MGRLFAMLVCGTVTLALCAPEADARGRGGGGGRSRSKSVFSSGTSSTPHKSSRKSSSAGYGTAGAASTDAPSAAERPAQAPAAPVENSIQQNYNAALKEACQTARPGSKLPAACQGLR